MTQQIFDLMPGNYVKHSASECEIVTAYQLQKYREYLEGNNKIPKHHRSIQGIPITVELLTSLGFSQTFDGIIYEKVISKEDMKPYHTKEIVISYSTLEKRVYLDTIYVDKITKNEETHYVSLPHIEFIHQIQNLYQSLTGYTLKLNTHETYS